MSSASLVEIVRLSKAFGGVRALCGVSLEIQPGQVHALCGENGAGKSTLIKILSGSQMANEGRVRVAGRDLALGSVRASEEAGIAVIHQETVIFPHLTAEENIFVGREPRRLGAGWLDRRRMRRDARKLLESLGEPIDPSQPVGRMRLAHRQMVAIARALARSCRLLIMDEPTASLSAREAEALQRIVRQLRAQGVSVLYVSHRLEEVFALADCVTVLRDGQLVDTVPVSQLDRARLIRMMVGRDLMELEQQSSPHAADRVPMASRPSPDESAVARLEVSDLSRPGAFHHVSFRIRAGEIVGMGGLMGAGRSEVARAIFGIDRPTSGRVVIDGYALPLGSVTHAIRHGVALVPEDRQQQGLVPPLPVAWNLTMPQWNRLAPRGAIRRSTERAILGQMAEQLAIRFAGPSAAARTLSGGNQQKLVLGKWLAMAPRVLLLDEPTRGIDVGAKAEIYRWIRSQADQGMAILLISSEMPELLLLSDRIVVMREGRISGELSREDASEERLLALALPETFEEAGRS